MGKVSASDKAKMMIRHVTLEANAPSVEGLASINYYYYIIFFLKIIFGKGVEIIKLY